MTARVDLDVRSRAPARTVKTIATGILSPRFPELESPFSWAHVFSGPHWLEFSAQFSRKTAEFVMCASFDGDPGFHSVRWSRLPSMDGLALSPRKPTRNFTKRVVAT
jgi:hypothetical protein